MTDMMTLTSSKDWYSEVPRSIGKHTVFGVLLMLAAFGGFGYWAFSAPLAAAIIAQGSFVATGQNKSVQHLEGGIIKQILVSEGENVEVNQPLVKMDETAALASQRQLLLRRIRLEAINARLNAEAWQLDDIEFAQWLNERRSDAEINAILESQVLNFRGSRRKLESDIRLLESNISALEFRSRGYSQQQQAYEMQIQVLNEDLASKGALYEKGYVRRPELNAIRRAVAEAEGQIARLAAQVDETDTQVKKLQQQILQTTETYQQSALDEMQSIQAELDSVREQSRNAQDILRRSVINAPVSGTIIRIYYHTAGGVIEGGKTILEILPTGVPLIIEAQVPRTEIDSIRVGQDAVVRLTALNQRTTPVLEGKVFYVSADSLPDTNSNITDREIYITRMSLDATEIKRIPGFTPTPGMPAEIMIKTAERTFFDYLTRPIVDSMSRAFRER